MDKFNKDAHARLLGNVLMVMGGLALLIALADVVPDEIFALRPHFFGSGGTLAVGLLLVLAGFLMRK